MVVTIYQGFGGVDLYPTVQEKAGKEKELMIALLVSMLSGDA